MAKTNIKKPPRVWKSSLCISPIKEKNKTRLIDRNRGAYQPNNILN